MIQSRQEIGSNEIQKGTKKMIRRNAWFAGLVAPLLIAIALLLPGSPSLAASSQSSPTTAAVTIDNFSFTPAELTVSVGTTVIWTNRDDIPHTIVSNDGVFKSKVRDTDETFSFTFDKAGTYSYFCSVHPKMTGKIVVQ
jgi:plastocyanin